jgi:hypothetical protein
LHHYRRCGRAIILKMGLGCEKLDELGRAEIGKK